MTLEWLLQFMVRMFKYQLVIIELLSSSDWRRGFTGREQIPETESRGQL